MTAMDVDPGRAARAAEALSDGRVRIRRAEDGAGYVVSSFSGPGTYLVRVRERHCTCPDRRFHQRTCKHLMAVALALVGGRPKTRRAS